MIAHGGDVWRVSAELGVDPSEILDFSANINPRGLPPRARERLARDASDARLLSFYPDPSARSLRNALGERLGVAPDAIAVGPGAESLLAPILRYLRPRRALIPVPAFSEYARVCQQQQVEFVPFPLTRAELFQTPLDRLTKCIESESPGIVLLNNPHNPSGAVLSADGVRRILDATNAAGATLLLDEAFVDYVPGLSLACEAAGRAGLVVIRSLTKFFGCPGLRVGYAIAHPDSICAIQSLLPTWPVTQLAMDALTEAVGDYQYAEDSIRENAAQRELLADGLRGLGLFVFPSSANYLFLELRADMPAGAELRARLLARHRILIRNCDSYEGLSPGRYIRVAVRSQAENSQLIWSLTREIGSA
jgi:threonine-phosphate decarboxylase